MIEELKELTDNLEMQKKKVDEKIGPILELCDQGKMTRKELVEKLSEAFHGLEKNEQI